LETIFWTFPVIKGKKYLIKKAPPRGSFKKMAEYGTILSMRYRNRHRGLVKDGKTQKRKKDMENGIEMDISLRDKNINICLHNSKKIGMARIRVTGGTSLEMIQETYQIIKNYLVNTQNQLSYIKNNPGILRDFIKQTIVEDTIVPIHNPDPHLQVYLEGIRYIRDPKALVKYCDVLSRYGRIYSGNLENHQIHQINVNYDYRLNFKIDRSKLAKLARHNHGFCTTYSKSKNHHKVILHLAIDPAEISRPFKKSKKKPCHTFRVNQSGCVKQISPDLRLGHLAYCQFMKLIMELEDEIKDTHS